MRILATFTPAENAATSSPPTAYNVLITRLRRRQNQAAATTPMVTSPPGMTQISPARSWVQLPDSSPTGVGDSRRASPLSTKNVASVAMTGCSRPTTTSRPFTRPPPARMSRSRGIETQGAPRPCGKSTATSRQLVRVAWGPTEMSIPPPPLSMGTVEANATRTNGASVPSSEGQLCGARKECCATTFAISSATTKTPAKTQLCVRRCGRGWRAGRGSAGVSSLDGRCVVDMLPLLRYWGGAPVRSGGIEVGRHDVGAGDLLAIQPGADRTVLEHEDTIGQVHQLIDLARQHDDGDSLGAQLVERCVHIVLRVLVDPARRVIQEQHARRVCECARHDDLLLVPPGQRRDEVAMMSHLHAERLYSALQAVQGAPTGDHAEDGVLTQC